MSRCFTMLKPGVINRRLVGEVIERLEKKGFKLVGMKMMHVSEDLAGKHYAEHDGKPFYKDLVDYVTSGPVIAMVWQADDCVTLMRKVVGATKPTEAVPGTIRGDYCIHTDRNIIHASFMAILVQLPRQPQGHAEEHYRGTQRGGGYHGSTATTQYYPMHQQHLADGDILFHQRRERVALLTEPASKIFHTHSLIHRWHYTTTCRFGLAHSPSWLSPCPRQSTSATVRDRQRFSLLL